MQYNICYCYCLSQQSRDELTLELSHAKAKVDQLLETNGSLEQARKLALQRHEMFEQEIRGLQDQVDNTRQVADVINCQYQF